MSVGKCVGGGMGKCGGDMEKCGWVWEEVWKVCWGKRGEIWAEVWVVQGRCQVSEEVLGEV